jgi:membrane associated rhomboid family serine protease
MRMNSYAPQLTPVVKVVLLVNVAVYLLERLPFTGPSILTWGKLVPTVTFADGQLWRLFTYMFLHDPYSVFHLLFNMLALWMFGLEIEQMWGSRRFAWFYMIGGVGSGCFSLFHLFSPTMSQVGVIGASGAVLALLTVYAWYFPDRKVLLFFILPVNIRFVVIGYAIISLFGSLHPHGIVSHLTHLGGILVAIGYLRCYPKALGWLQQRAASKTERNRRRQGEEALSRERFFEENIDPILEKISREGMESLTAQERILLKKTAKSKEHDRLKKSKVLPLDLFR